MKEKVELLIKYTPIITVICYICGFVIFNSHLLQYGIIDTNIFNLRFIEAGILYLLIAPFILTTNLVRSDKLGILGSISTAFFAFLMFNNIFGTSDALNSWKEYLIVIGLNGFVYIAMWAFRNTKIDHYDLTERPLMFLVCVIISMMMFSIYYKEIRSNFGGGQTYSKVLILKEKKENLIHTDTLLHTDTLTIVYENNDFIYFLKSNSILSLRKDIVEGEILVKNRLVPNK